MVNLKKSVALFLSLLMVLGLLAACSGDSSGSTSTGGGGTTSSSGGTSTSTGGGDGEELHMRDQLAAYDDVYKLSAFLGLGTVAPPDPVNNLYAKYTREVLKIDVSDVEYTSSPELAKVLEKVGLMVAAGSMPDIVTLGWNAQVKDMVQQFVDAGMLMETEDYLRNKMPNLWSDLNDDILDAYRMADGKIYVIPSGAINAENTERPYTIEPNLALVKRTDLWEEAGITTDPKTPEEFYEVLKTLKEKYPTMNGQEFYPFHGLAIGWDFDILFAAAFGAYTHAYLEKHPTEDRFIGVQETEEYLEYLKWAAKLYHEGLVDPEMFINNYDVLNTRGGEGRIGSYIGYPNDIDNYTNQAKLVDPDAMYNALPLPRVEGLESTMYWHQPGLGSQITMISKNAGDADRIVKYIDWQMTTEGWIFNCYGGPGANENEGPSRFNEDGYTLSYNTEFMQEIVKTEPTYTASCGGWSYFNVQRIVYHIDHLGYTNITESPDPQRLEAREYNLGETVINYDYDRYLAIAYGPLEQAKAAAVEKVRSDGLAKIITSGTSDEHVEQLYEQWISDLISAGWHDIAKERYAAYQELYG